jgi:DNA-directed RNA polymerase subunit M/transcription elongation factor TFIIS
MNTSRIMNALETMTADALEAHRNEVLASTADHNEKTCTKCEELAEADAILNAHDTGDRGTWKDTNSVPDPLPEVPCPACKSTRVLYTLNTRTGDASCKCSSCRNRWHTTIKS